MGAAVYLLGEVLPFNNIIILGYQIVFGIGIYTVIAKVEEFEAIYQLVNGSNYKVRVTLLLILKKI